MNKLFRTGLTIIIILLILGFILLKFQTHDRHPGYQLNLALNSQNMGQISAGFAAVSITPEIIDTWNDADKNARYEPKKGDTFNDLNKNGKFDATWIAGFHNRRPANGIHDSLWARTVVFDDGTSRIALVSLDAIGFFHDQVIDVREKIPENLGIDYCMIASTHDHEAPDLMGIWGESFLKSGVNEEYMELVINKAVKSVETAVANLEPVTLHFSKNDSDALHLVTDTRKPTVHDPGMYIIQAKNKNGNTKGLLVSWADHPETLWSSNLLITSDFPHYFRKEIEKQTGGTCVYFNGAIGGLITTHPTISVKHPVTGQSIKEASFEKAEAQGMQLANIAIKSMNDSKTSISNGNINLVAKTFNLPFKNTLFRLGAVLGILDRGMSGWWKIRTEIAAFTIGPASFLTVPGEIYPEIVNGGIESPVGQDFNTEAIEVPPLRSKMPGQFKFVIGMGNDELGYIIPKSEWDNEEPWLYNSIKELYGEENSLGPETAPIVHEQALELLEEIN